MNLTQKQIEYYFKEPEKVLEASIHKFIPDHKILIKRINGFHAIQSITEDEIESIKELEKSKNFTVRIKRGESQEEVDKKFNYMKERIQEFRNE